MLTVDTNLDRPNVKLHIKIFIINDTEVVPSIDFFTFKFIEQQ